MRAQWIERLPKMELHCHLDGSVHPERIRAFYRQTGRPRPEDAPLRARESCESLTEYLRCFDLPLQWLQTEVGLEQAVRDLLGDAAREHIRYLDIRFAPTLHLEGSLTYRQVFDALARGCARGETECGVVSRLIVCAMRHHTQAQNLAMLDAARDYFPALVCAADLAGDENAFPTALHAPFFRQAAAWGIPFTIHSGETGSAANVRTALDLGAARLGHGIAMAGHPDLIARCRAAGVGVELCPTSNFQTKAARGWAEYPLRAFLDAGLLVSLHTDNRTVSGTNLNREYLRAVNEGGCTPAEVVQMLRNACAVSFAPEGVKRAFLRELEEAAREDDLFSV